MARPAPWWLRTASLAVAALLAACGSEAVLPAPDLATAPPPPPPPDATQAIEDLAAPPLPDLGPKACAPSLTISPADPVVNPFGLATFRGGGGTGAYRFALVTAMPGEGSGAIVNDLSGAYLAGARAGVGGSVVDVIELTDTGCIGSARASVKVVPHIEVRPRKATVPPMTKFTLEVLGGSGTFTYQLLQAGSGATLTGAVYAAGGRTGLDSIKVTDTATGDVVIADITVDPAAQLLPEPTLVMLPVGATFKLSVRGGSGFLDAAVNGNAATYKDGVLTAAVPGSATLDLTDHFSRQSARVRVDVSAAQRMVTNRAGDQQSTGVVAVGRNVDGSYRTIDLDGDGLADGILGQPESDVAAYNSGAVYIYKGRKGGPAAVPDRVLSGEGREDYFGRALAAGDFDGDGEIDLAIGAPRADSGTTDNGAVFLYRGVGNGLLSAKPAQILSGQNAFDYFGYSLAACDFNGDGRLDLAVGAVLGEDTQAMPRTNDQGSVSIFLGYPDGFLNRPDAIAFGQIPDGQGVWKGQTSLQMGWSLAAGDVDGDGKCDLVPGTINFNSTWGSAKVDGGRPNDGAAWVFAGLGPSGPSPGGVRSTPSRFYAGADADANSQLSRSLAAADLDGDGKAEVILGQAWADTFVANKSYTDAGAVRVFAGGPLAAMPPAAYTTASKADFSILGNTAFNYLGFHVVVGDADSDTISDLIVGHWIDDIGVADAGSIRVYAGRKGAMPGDVATRFVGGTQIGERLGQAVGAPGDMDGDGKSDLLAFAGLTDVGDATDLGAPYFIDGTVMPVPQRLDTPSQASGAWMGYSSTLLDLNNDGFTDMAVGVPLADPVFAGKPQSGLNAGVVQIYLGNANGIPADPSMTLKQFVGHSDWDQFGWRVAPAGDFDGDGLQDLAVVARYEDGPGGLADARYDANGCAGASRGDAGAVYVFRGSRGGVPAADPAFILFGPQQSFRIDSLDGGMDVNGDGKGDLVIGSWDWRSMAGASRNGGFEVILGRAATPGKTRVMCDPALLAYGNEVNALLGTAVAGVPDVDGDGCAEVVVGAPDEHLPNADNVPYQGVARLVFGWGGARCPARPRMIALRSKEAYSRLGTSLAAADLDNDKIPELAIGALYHPVGGAGNPGGAWLVPGTWLRTLAQGAATIPGNGDLADPPTAAPLPPGVMARLLVEGSITNELYGQSVALVPDLGNGRGGLAVGAPATNLGGVTGSGGVRVFQYLGANQGLDPVPVAVFGGETTRTGARVGENLVAGRVAGAPALAIAAYLSSATSLDYGAAYLAPIRLP